MAVQARDPQTGTLVSAYTNVRSGGAWVSATARVKDAEAGVWIPKAPWDALNDDGTAWQPFDTSSPWRTPWLGSTVVRSDSDAIMSFVSSTATQGIYTITEDAYSTPMYWAKPDDPVYNVTCRTAATIPSEFSALRIPFGATPASGTDGQVVVFDLGQQIVCNLWRAQFDGTAGTWSVEGGSAYHFDGNGLATGVTNGDSRNGGFRGQPGSLVGIRRQEVDDGVIPHVIRGSFSLCQNTYVWPFNGTDGKSSDPTAPPQGSIMRIKQGIDIASYGLSGDALIIAIALQNYGLLVADSNGSTHVSITMEPTVAELRGPTWGISRSALSVIPWTDFEVMQPLY